MASYNKNLQDLIATSLSNLEQRRKSKIQTAVIAALGNTNGTESATEQSKYISYVHTHTAQSSIAMQAAKDAVIKLAVDVNSVYSIVNAEDIGTDIYNISKETVGYINETSHSVLKLNQSAMELSMLAAEIPDIPVTMQEDEGLSGLDYIDYLALQYTSVSVNKLLNNDLIVDVTKQGKLSTINVSFSPYQSPFTTKAVDGYYLIIVKDSKKSLFNIDAAEGITNAQFCTKLTDAQRDSKNKEGKLTAVITKMTDADGDAVSVDENYVIFLCTVLTQEYKKRINYYADCLSAPSSLFKLNDSPISSVREKDYHAVVSFLSDKGEKHNVWQPLPGAGNTKLFTNVYVAVKNMEIAYDALVRVDSEAKKLLGDTNTCLLQLIYSSLYINKLGETITRKKALNPLISDDLISRITSAGTDATNAVVLLTTALGNVITTQTSVLLSGAVTTYQYDWLVKRYEILTSKYSS